MTTDLNTLLTALYVKIDDHLGRPAPTGRPPRLTDAELITLAAAQALLGIRSEARWLPFLPRHLPGASTYLPQQSGYNKRLRTAVPLLKKVIRLLALDTDLGTDTTWVVDSTPVECGRSRATTKRSELAGWAGHGYCSSHSRFFRGLRLHLICTDGYGDYAFLPRTGEVTYYNALYVRALQGAAGLARATGHPADADRWLSRASGVSAAVNEYLWDPARARTSTPRRARCATARTATATPAGLPITRALANPKLDERQVLMAILDHNPSVLADRPGLLIIADKGYVSRELDAFPAERGVQLLRPNYRNRTPHPAEHLLKPVRQLIKPVNNTHSKASSTSSCTAAAPSTA